MFLFVIIESVDSISRDERDVTQMQYITNAGISQTRYTIMHFKHLHLVLWLISNRMSIYIPSLLAQFYVQVQSMDDNCGECVECMGVANGCG